MNNKRNYRRDYMLTHDIDWFFCYKGLLFHAASNGSIIPDIITAKTNSYIQEFVYFTIEERHNAKINEKYINEFIASNLILSNEFENNPISFYTKSFESMARKGFISMDMCSDGKYRIIAFPDNLQPHKDSDQQLYKMIPTVEELPIEIEGVQEFIQSR